MLNTLKNRLTLTLLLIVVLVGGASLWVGQLGMRLYYEELSQTLNRDIAMYVTDEHKLIEGELGSKAAIEKLAHQAMIINPVAEVYLLNPAGEIISHALPPEEIKRDAVNLEPLNQFLSGNGSFPLRGNDPRHLDTDKIFSVSEIRNDQGLQGYLYVILGGKLYDDIQNEISWGHISQQTSWAVLLITIGCVLLGVVLFNLLARPLLRLTDKMCEFSRTELGGHEQMNEEMTDPSPTSTDEIEKLDNIFSAMSMRIREQFEQLRESDRLRRELISNVSHDLRTPLATIQGYLETLIIKNDSLSLEQRDRYLRTAEHGCRRLSQLIADLFELSKLESGNTQPTFEQFSIAELMYDTVQEFELEAQRKGVSIQMETPRQSTLVYADIGLIQRVFENLLRNAIAHTPAQGNIRLRFSETPSAVQVTVADTGSGISDQDIPHIFDRFYQSASQPQEKKESSGLGLAIVKRILDLHGCRIEVASQVDQGTRFNFELPAVQQAG